MFFNIFIYEIRGEMGLLEIITIGIGLSMDAFAASVCEGLSMKKLNFKRALIIAFFFGFFQFIMPVIGYYFCVQFESYIENIDHWIAFSFLVFIGAKLIFDAIKDKKESKVLQFGTKEEPQKINIKTFSIKRLFILAIATSIDALAIGISFAFFEINIFSSCAIIGVITFFLSMIGVVISNYFGEKYKMPAQIFGGVILIAIGFKILLEHLGIITF